MNLKMTDATAAYANALKSQGITGSGKVDKISASGSLGGEGGAVFSDVLKSALTDTSEAISKSENVGIQALNKQADLVDVVTTVQNAEMVLETVVAVRDKVIGAYQDIIKMPI